MSFQRIWAMVLRYLYATRDTSRIAEFLIWPVIDMGFLGLIATWFASLSASPDILTAYISALILWQLIYRSNFEICFNILDEFWEQNLLNLLSTPLKPSEWVLATMLSGTIKIVFTLCFGAFAGWIFFQINIFSLGWTLPMFAVLCLLSGWIIGFLGAGIIIYKGSKLPQIPWVVITLVAVFSSIYYPLNILPYWMQTISQALPMTYLFEGLREWIKNGSVPFSYFIKSLILSAFYLTLAIMFFFYMFEKSREKGFSRLI